MTLLAICLTVSAIGAGPKATVEQFESAGKRSYIQYVPERAAGSEAPLLILLHGSGRDGRSPVEPWKDLADREGIVLAGLNATIRDGWDLRNDGPQVLKDLVDAVHGRTRVDQKRIYLFGHSAGAIQALMLGLLESEYFAGVAVHAGALPQESSSVIEMAERKIPMAMWVGSRDPFFPVDSVKAAQSALEAQGFAVRLRVINGHTHDYYGRSREINQDAWKFLLQQRLEHDPKFKEYVLR
jgi:poly(3-hydroxybutyrate) depolymerase